MSKTALVTGASRGIGADVARGLSNEGYRVILAVRTPAQAPSISNSVVEALDVASATSIEALASRLAARGEKLDVLVNNAAVNRQPSKEIWNVNMRGPLLLTRALAPLLADGAKVVMVSSGMARGASPALTKRLAAMPRMEDLEKLCDEAPGDYSNSKAALNRLAQLFASELKPRHILVNAISPGWCRTDMGGEGAPRSALQGAESVLWGCRLGPDGPSGGFFEDGKRAD